jgi:hypothetical protein
MAAGQFYQRDRRAGTRGAFVFGRAARDCADGRSAFKSRA